MKQILKIILIIALIFSLKNNFINSKATTNEEEQEVNMKRDILVCMLAYPEMIKGVERDKDGNVYLIMKNGKKVLYDDRVKKLYEDKFINSDVEDSLSEAYPLEDINCVMDDNKDPGRIRCYKLFNEMYGSNQEEIEKNIKNVTTYYGNVMFNTLNNAADNLKSALIEVSELIKQDSTVSAFVVPLSGGYNFRYIQDSGVLSAHAYGIAVDLNKNDSDYWKWVSKEQGSKRIASYPKELVKIFENHGFVWGGKWAHFDILHFEYRPEIILKAKYFGGQINSKKGKWYEGIPIDENTKTIIKHIDDALDM